MAAFLNALREEGTKADCIRMLEKMWGDELALREENARLKTQLVTANEYADEISQELYDMSEAHGALNKGVEAVREEFDALVHPEPDRLSFYDCKARVRRLLDQHLPAALAGQPAKARNAPDDPWTALVRDLQDQQMQARSAADQRLYTGVLALIAQHRPAAQPAEQHDGGPCVVCGKPITDLAEHRGDDNGADWHHACAPNGFLNEDLTQPAEQPEERS